MQAHISRIKIHELQRNGKQYTTVKVDALKGAEPNINLLGLETVKAVAAMRG